MASLFLGEVWAEGWLVAFTPGARRGTAGKLAGKVGTCLRSSRVMCPQVMGPLAVGSFHLQMQPRALRQGCPCAGRLQPCMLPSSDEQCACTQHPDGF